MEKTENKCNRLKRPIKKTLGILASAFILIVSALTILISYAFVSSIVRNENSKRLNDVITIAESMIDVDDLGQCAQTNVKSEKYNELQQNFNVFIDQVDIMYLYIVIPKENGLLNILSATSQAERDAGEEDMELGYLEEGYSSSELKHYRDGYDKSEISYFEEIYRFKGGKGFLVTFALLWVLDWRAGLVATAVMLTVLPLSGFMSLSSILTLIAGGVTLCFTHTPLSALFLTFGAILLVIWRHRGNIARLIAGTEKKFSFRKKKPASVEPTPAEEEKQEVSVGEDKE